MQKKTISLEEFHELYELKQNYVSVANSYVQEWEKAEDIVADSYMYLLENMGRIEVENPNAYLLGVVRHKCLDALRHGKTTQKVQERIYENIRKADMETLAEQDASHILFGNEVSRIFREQLTRMPELTSAVFVESRIKGKTHNEISAKFGIPVRTVTYEISKAIKILKKSLGEYLVLAILIYVSTRG